VLVFIELGIKDKVIRLYIISSLLQKKTNTNYKIGYKYIAKRDELINF